MIDDILPKLVALEQSGRWNEILDITGRYVDKAEQANLPGWFWFFRGMAQLKTGRLNDAIEAAERGLQSSANNRWGNKVYFDALREAGRHREAFEKFRRFIESSEEHEQEKEWFIEKATELGYFEIAARMNETRAKIAKLPSAPRYALALQCFVKADTLAKVLDSFLHLDSSRDFSLVILQDNNIANASGKDRRKEENEVRQLIGSYIPALSEQFFSVELLRNFTNLGTAPSCRRLLDHVARTHDGFLFVEDDCPLDRSALEWTRYHLENNIRVEGSWFVSCESICFDAADRAVNAETLQLLQKIASHNVLSHAYSHIDFVPSTCFATRTEFWRLCANARSFTRGPESLSILMKQFGKKTIVPIVPRASDIGMKHELGYSVNNLGESNVKENKNVVLMANIKFDQKLCQLFDGDLETMFRATSAMNTAELKAFISRFSI